MIWSNAAATTTLRIEPDLPRLLRQRRDPLATLRHLIKYVGFRSQVSTNKPGLCRALVIF